MTKEEVFESVKNCIKAEDYVSENNEEENFVIYIHVNLINGKVYVGQTCQVPLTSRWGKDGTRYTQKNKNNKYWHKHFGPAILKYGWNNFGHYVLEDGLTKEEAVEREQFYMNKYNSLNRDFGYNLREAGPRGRMSEEAKKRMSESTKGENHPLYGKHHSKETREKIKQALTGRKVPREQVEKMRKTLTGRKHSEKWKQHIKEGHAKSDKKNVVSVVCVETEKHFKSVIEAENFIMENYGYSSGHILDCCLNQTNTYGGFHWIRERDIDKENWQKQKFFILNAPFPTSRPVECIETKEIFENSARVQDKTKIDSTSILRCCRGKQMTAGKKHWRFISQEEYMERRYMKEYGNFSQQ